MRLPFVYDDGGRAAAGFRGKAGDCVTRALAIAAGRPYREVYDVLSAGNRAQRRTVRSRRAESAAGGVYTSRLWFRRYVESLGGVWTPTMRVGAGCTVHLRAGELPGGRLAVQVSRHMTAVVNGVIRDEYDPSRDGSRCVYGFWSFPS